MDYRYEATSVTGFVQLVASNYLCHGYWFHVSGVVSPHKDPRAIDEKLLTKYGVRISRQQRARRKQAGQANVHYLRYKRFWILLATHGEHLFFQEEAASIRDARRAPIHFEGYSISVKQGNYLRKQSPDELPTPDHRYRVRVQMSREQFRTTLAWMREIACRHTTEKLRWEFWNLPFEPYAPIRRQWLMMLREVNEKRQSVRLERLEPSELRYRRRIVKPFEHQEPTSEVMPAITVTNSDLSATAPGMKV